MLLWLAGALMGCEDEGSGATFPAADLVRFDGGTLVAGEQSVEDESRVRVEAPTEDGHTWALQIDGGYAIAGVPAAGEVRRYKLDGTDAAVGELVARGAASEDFGASVAVRGDTRVVGAPRHASSPDAAAAGAVDLFGGGALRLEGTESQGRLGASVAACGDLDGDGLDDLAAAATWADDLAGAVYLFPTDGSVILSSAARRLAGPAAGAQYGAALLCSDDLLGEPTLVVGAPFGSGAGGASAEGRVELWTASAVVEVLAVATLTGRSDLEAVGSPEYFGSSLARCDLDADGLADLAVGAPGASLGLGAAYVWFGASGFAGGSTAPVVIRGASSGAHFGSALACADLDGNGADELLVGAPGVNAQDGTREIGAIYVYQDLAADSGQLFDIDAWATLTHDRAWLRTGDRFVAGDLDGDGAAELVVLVRQRAR